jgi:hypothetical protein
MALFSSWLYVRVSWLCFLPGYMWGCHGFIFFLVICEGVSWLYIYNQEENKDMRPSHITRKKIKPWNCSTKPSVKICHMHVDLYDKMHCIMALFSSWLYVSVSSLYFLPGYMWMWHGFIFFLVICEDVMALISSWLYVSVSWLYVLPGYKENKAMKLLN